MAEGNLFLNISFDYEKLANNVIKHLTQDQIKQACLDSISIDPIKTEHYEEEIEEDEYKEWPDDIDWNLEQKSSRTIKAEDLRDIVKDIQEFGLTVQSYSIDSPPLEPEYQWISELTVSSDNFWIKLEEGDIVEFKKNQVTIIRRDTNERVTYDKDLS